LFPDADNYLNKRKMITGGINGPAFHAGNTGSNPVGDAKYFS